MTREQQERELAVRELKREIGSIAAYIAQLRIAMANGTHRSTYEECEGRLAREKRRLDALWETVDALESPDQ